MKKWKIFFWVVSVIFVISLVTTPFRTEHTLFDAITLILTGLSLIPLYGYPYQARIGTKVIATCIFLTNLALFALVAYLIATSVGVKVAAREFFGLVVFFVLYMYPQYLYAFKSDHLWSEKTQNA